MSLTFEQRLYGKITIDTLQLTSGEIKRIDISLGSRITVQEWIRIAGDTITIQPKQKSRKTLKRHRKRLFNNDQVD